MLKNLIDTHCHLNSPELRNSSQELFNRALENGISRLIIIGCDLNDSIEAVNISENFSQYASIGIHPHETKNFPEIPQEFYELSKNKRVIAIGEIGLDYYYDNSPREIQIEMFKKQLDFSRELKLPVILHIRDAMNDAINILHDYQDLKLLFHCYSGGLEFLDEVLKFNSLCAFGGALTWKNSHELREVVKQIPIERLVLETDCPYMAPIPFRGKLNEPSYIKYVYEKASELKNIPVQDLADKININVNNFFNI